MCIWPIDNGIFALYSQFKFNCDVNWIAGVPIEFWNQAPQLWDAMEEHAPINKLDLSNR